MPKEFYLLISCKGICLCAPVLCCDWFLIWVHDWMPFASLFISTVSSQTQCMQTFNISASFGILTVEGGVQTCFRCLFDGAVNPSTTWTLNSVLISPSDGIVTDGVLTIFDPAAVVPGVSFFTQLACVAASQQYTVFLRRRGRLGSTKLCLRVCMCVHVTCIYLCMNCVSICVWMMRWLWISMTIFSAQIYNLQT